MWRPSLRTLVALKDLSPWQSQTNGVSDQAAGPHRAAQAATSPPPPGTPCRERCGLSPWHPRDLLQELGTLGKVHGSGPAVTASALLTVCPASLPRRRESPRIMHHPDPMSPPCCRLCPRLPRLHLSWRSCSQALGPPGPTSPAAHPCRGMFSTSCFCPSAPGIGLWPLWPLWPQGVSLPMPDSPSHFPSAWALQMVLHTHRQTPRAWGPQCTSEVKWVQTGGRLSPHLGPISVSGRLHLSRGSDMGDSQKSEGGEGGKEQAPGGGAGGTGAQEGQDHRRSSQSHPTSLLGQSRGVDGGGLGGLAVNLGEGWWSAG